MVRIEITYQGSLRCQASHGPSGATLLTDAPADNQGRAESFSPTDLVASALGTCVLTIMGIVADRHGLDLTGARATVQKEMIADPTRRIASLATLVEVPVNPGAEGRRLLESAAAHCPVHASLGEAVDAPVSFRWGASDKA
jgi:putative redox protein